MKVASFFAGCGGLDLGFEQAGYEVVWANEFDESIYTTYELNHPNTILCKKSITDGFGRNLYLYLDYLFCRNDTFWKYMGGCCCSDDSIDCNYQLL